MSTSIALVGTLSIGGDLCGPCSPLGGGSSQNVRAISLGPCGIDGDYYQSVVTTGAALVIATAGAIGDTFEDLDLLEDLTAIEMLYVKTRGPLILRVGAAAARILGSGGTFPTGFAGGETLNVDIDGTSVPVVFAVGDQSAAAVVARINAAAALVGLPTPRASVHANGQVQIDGVLTGPQGSVEVTGGTGAATLGLSGSEAVGSGSDFRINGLALLQFDKAAPPSRVQVSGSGTLELVAAGRA
jgi:hypothetical protein